MPLMRGDMVFTDTDSDKLLVFKRSYKESTYLCAFNLDRTAKTINVPGEFQDCMDDTIPFARGLLREGALTLPAFGFFIGKN